jgi:hypothetical protein
MLALPASKGGLNIKNPCTTAKDHYKTATAATKGLVDALVGRDDWDARGYSQSFKLAVLVNGVQQAKAQWTEAMHLGGVRPRVPTQAEAPDPVEGQDPPPPRLQGRIRAAYTRALMYPTHGAFVVRPSKEAKTALTKEEFLFGYAIRYGQQPPKAPLLCSGEACNAPLSLDHSQLCRKGGAWIKRHNKVKFALADCAQLATSMSPQVVRTEVPIDLSANRPNAASTNHQAAGQGAQSSRARNERDPQVDVRIKGLGGERKVYSVDVRITHLDSATNTALGRSVDDILRRHAQEKRDKYLAAVRDIGDEFNPFVLTTCGIFSPPAEEMLTMIAKQYAEKRGMPLSLAKAMMRARIAVSLIKGACWCMYGDRSIEAREARLLREAERDSGPGETEIRELFSVQRASQVPI